MSGVHESYVCVVQESKVCEGVRIYKISESVLSVNTYTKCFV